jgi:hypothetical protein
VSRARRQIRLRSVLILVAAVAVVLGLIRGFFRLDNLDRIMVSVVGGSALASMLFISGTTSVARLIAGRLDPGPRDDLADSSCEGHGEVNGQE